MEEIQATDCGKYWNSWVFVFS